MALRIKISDWQAQLEAFIDATRAAIVAERAKGIDTMPEMEIVFDADIVTSVQSLTSETLTSESGSNSSAVTRSNSDTETTSGTDTTTQSGTDTTTTTGTDTTTRNGTNGGTDTTTRTATTDYNTNGGDEVKTSYTYSNYS